MLYFGMNDVKEDNHCLVINIFCMHVLHDAHFLDVDGGHSFDEMGCEIIRMIDCIHRLGESWLLLLEEYLKDLYLKFKTNSIINEQNSFYLLLGLMMMSLLLNHQNDFTFWSRKTAKMMKRMDKNSQYESYNLLEYPCFFHCYSIRLWKRYLDRFKPQIINSKIYKNWWISPR